MELPQTLQRANRIDEVRQMIQTATDMKRLIDYEELATYVSQRFNVSDRLAKEYIKLAKMRVKGYMSKEWAKGEYVEVKQIEDNYTSPDGRSRWQHALEDEKDPLKREMINFEFLDKMGINTKNWKIRKDTEKKLKKNNNL